MLLLAKGSILVSRYKQVNDWSWYKVSVGTCNLQFACMQALEIYLHFWFFKKKNFLFLFWWRFRICQNICISDTSNLQYFPMVKICMISKKKNFLLEIRSSFRKHWSYLFLKLLHFYHLSLSFYNSCYLLEFRELSSICCQGKHFGNLQQASKS